MIHVISKENQHLYGELLDQMYVLRHKVFVEDKGWEKLRRIEGLEIDQFDTENTVYFLKVDEHNKILGGMRMVPTEYPTQLSTIFRKWCHFKAAPQRSDVWEWSRYFIADNKYRSKSGYPVFYELFFSILEYAVHRGIKSITGFLEASTLPRLNGLPWDVEYLGNIVTYGGEHGEPQGKGAAVQVNVNPRMLRVTKRIKKMAKPFFGLPLGDQFTDLQVAFKPEVCFAVLEFMRDHPEYEPVLLMLANTIARDKTAGDGITLEAVNDWLDDAVMTEVMDGFDVPYLGSRVIHGSNLAKQ